MASDYIKKVVEDLNRQRDELLKDAKEIFRDDKTVIYEYPNGTRLYEHGIEAAGSYGGSPETNYYLIRKAGERWETS